MCGLQWGLNLLEAILPHIAIGCRKMQVMPMYINVQDQTCSFRQCQCEGWCNTATFLCVHMIFIPFGSNDGAKIDSTLVKIFNFLGKS